MAIDTFDLGPETLVNTTTSGSQESTGVIYHSPSNSLATLADGHIVAVWDDGSDGDVKARILAPDSPVSSEIDIAAGTDAQVAALPNGDFVVLWTASGAIKYQIFNNLGVAVSSIFTPLSSAFTYTGSSVAALSNGNILLTLTYNSGATTSTAYATEFTPEGVFTGTQFTLGTVSSTSSSASGNVDAAQLPNGNIAFTWVSGTGTINREVLTPGGSTVWSGVISNNGSNPVVTALSNGNVVFAYDENGAPSPPDVDYEVLTSSGGLVTTGIQTANTVTTGGQFYPDIAATSDGGFVIAWEDNSGIGGDNSSYAVKERAFDSSGNPLTGETLVNTITSGFQGLPSVTGLAGGGAYTTWADFSGLAVPGQTADTSPPGLKGQATTFYDDTTYAGAATFFWSDAAGDVATSAMNGEQMLQTHIDPSVPVGWNLVAGGDFNNDGYRDMLFRNPTTGQNAIWFMYGDVVAGESLINPTTTDWSVVGTGDFNGDGNADILWHSTTGQNAIWEMNGSTQVAASLLPSVPAGWTPVGVGDFDGDGKSDILWRSTSGQDAIWFMNGTSVASEALINPTTTDWSVVGVGDFNGDGKADILWRSTSGQDAIWDMNGSTVTSAQLTNPVSTDWTVAGVGDFNHDNHSDILWQNTSSNQVALWEMNNTTVLPNNSIIASAGPGWHLTV